MNLFKEDDLYDLLCYLEMDNELSKKYAAFARSRKANGKHVPTQREYEMKQNGSNPPNYNAKLNNRNKKMVSPNRINNLKETSNVENQMKNYDDLQKSSLNNSNIDYSKSNKITKVTQDLSKNGNIKNLKTTETKILS